MGTYRGKVLVLKSRNLGEADRVLTLLSEEHGKFEAVVKGARRQRSRFVGNTLPFNYLNALFFTGSSLEVLSQAELIHSFAILREELVKLAFTSYWVELVDSFLPEKEPAKDIFRFILAAFITLEKAEKPELLNLAFEARILNYLGYQPHIDSCVCCGNTLEGRFLVSADLGGATCRNCIGEAQQSIQVSGNEVDLLNKIVQTDMRELDRLTVGAAQVNTLRNVLRCFIAVRLDHPLKAQLFLDNVLT